MKASELHPGDVGQLVIVSSDQAASEVGLLVTCEHSDIAIRFLDGSVYHLNDKVDIEFLSV